MVPAHFERHLEDLLRKERSDDSTRFLKAWKAMTCEDGEPKIPVPARVSSTSVGLHQDCLNPLDSGEPGFIAGYIAVVYLTGSGSFLMSSASGEERIDIVPRRLIMWPNQRFLHGVEAPPGGGKRAMLGPMTIDGDGWIQRAHDIHSVHASDHFMKQAEKAEKQGDDRGVREALASMANWDACTGRDAGALLREYEARHANKPSLCLTLSREADADGTVLIGTGLSGEEVSRIKVSEPDKMTYGQVKEMLLKELSSDIANNNKLQIMLPDATLIGADSEPLSVSKLFNSNAAASSGHTGNANTSEPNAEQTGSRRRRRRGVEGGRK